MESFIAKSHIKQNLKRINVSTTEQTLNRGDLRVKH